MKFTIKQLKRLIEGEVIDARARLAAKSRNESTRGDAHDMNADPLADVFDDRMQPASQRGVHDADTVRPDSLDDLYGDELERDHDIDESLSVDDYRPFPDFEEPRVYYGSRFCDKCYGELDTDGECQECNPESERDIEFNGDTMVDDLAVDDIYEGHELDENDHFPDTARGAKDALKAMSRPELHAKIDSARAQPDPQVEGVWVIYGVGEDYAPDVIVYLGGYEDPFGNVRNGNDFEECTAE